MRDLYAVQFTLPDPDDVNRALLLAVDWCSRATGGSISNDAFLEAGTYDGGEGRAAEVVRDDTLWSATVTAPNDSDPTLTWRTQATIGGPGGPIVTVRIGLGSTAPGNPRVAPLDYQFGSPALVRTLLRDFSIEDGGQFIVPEAILVGASEIPRLVEFLTSPSRRLPVLVLTGDPATGRPPIPAAGSGPPASHIARELAGLAHVMVLTSGLAGRALTQALGRERSVWHGAARIYWPGFVTGSDPFDHRFWPPARLKNVHRPFVQEVRTWLSMIAVTRTPPHPGLTTARRTSASSDAELLQLFEEENQRLEEENRELEVQLETLAVAKANLEAKVQAISYKRDAELDNDPDGVQTATNTAAPASVREALELVEEEYADELVVLESARRSAEAFDQYQDPEKALRALRAVAEASAALASGGLGMSLNDFFQSKGFAYSATNAATKAKKFRSHYTINYGDKKRIMEPHLKVDEATSPDQCMRIYWWKDEEEKVFVVGHVGRHLPPIPGS